MFPDVENGVYSYYYQETYVSMISIYIYLYISIHISSSNEEGMGRNGYGVRGT